MHSSPSDKISKYHLPILWLISSALAVLISCGLLIWVQSLLGRKVASPELMLIVLSSLVFNGFTIYFLARWSKRTSSAKITELYINALKQSESRLQKVEHYNRAFIESLPFMVWFKDEKSRFISVNTALAKHFGKDNPVQVIGTTDFDYSPKELAEYYLEQDLATLQSNQTMFVEETAIDAQGKIRWLETFKLPVTDNHGNLLGTAGYARDITERKVIENELRVSAIAMESQEGIIITDANSKILKINDAFTKITGFSTDEAVGNRMTLLKSGVHDATFYKEMWQSISNNGAWQGEIWNKRKCGEIYPEWLTISAVKNAEGVVTNYVGTMIDITARKSIEERVHHMAHYDPLTDLPNRSLLTDRLNQGLAQARRESSMLAVMFLDLDKFKIVNDSLGHHIGDALLKAVAIRLTDCIKRKTDTVSRIGGDEFVVLLTKVDGEQNVAIIAQEIIQSLTETFYIEEHVINISCSIGISLHPKNHDDSASLLRSADNAMYESKHAGRGCFRFSKDHSTNQSSPDNLS